jgi:hypothetical protein
VCCTQPGANCVCNRDATCPDGTVQVETCVAEMLEGFCTDDLDVVESCLPRSD